MKTHLILLITFLLTVSCTGKQGAYVCPPCNLPCDKLTFNGPGECPHCKMTLIKKSRLIEEANLEVNDIHLKRGSGVFLIEGASGRAEKTIKVYYHKPKNFTPESRVLFVIPGTGRDGDEYRDAWKQASEKYSVLILSPKYEESSYPFEDYHLGGVVDDINLMEVIEFIDGSNKVFLNEDKLEYSLEESASEWLFHDFDRIFEAVVESLQSLETRYDIFGHSAGGQILHRMALLSSSKKVDRIVAANAGFYTLPDVDARYPFGINGLNLTNEHMATAFSRPLIVLAGELDNENETRGNILRSKTLNEQGIHRLERAKYFFNYSKSKAVGIQADYHWSLNIVPNTGHDFRKMSKAAASYLYEPKINHTRWLIGIWENQTSSGSIFETWQVKNPKELAGQSYMVKQSDTTIFETITIFEEGDDLFYIPTVTDQNDAQPVRFKATTVSPSKMIFENPEHDFPQKITYEQVNKDSLVAQISGLKDGKKRRSNFPMRRVY